MSFSANLRQMHFDNEQGVPTSSRVGEPPPTVAPTGYSSLSPRKDGVSEDSRGFARGGNGIFGEGKVSCKQFSNWTMETHLILL